MTWEKIQSARNYWHDKLREQIDELMFLSLEGYSEDHEALMEAIETSMLIIWRFDRRLERYDSDTADQT